VNVRAASFRDLARVEQLYRDALAADESGPGPHPDSPVPQATLLRLWYALSKTLSSLVPLSDTRDRPDRHIHYPGRRHHHVHPIL